MMLQVEYKDQYRQVVYNMDQYKKELHNRDQYTQVESNMDQYKKEQRNMDQSTQVAYKDPSMDQYMVASSLSHMHSCKNRHRCIQ